MSVKRSLVLAAVVVGATAAPAAAQDSLTNPAYPGNTLSAKPTEDQLVAGTSQTVDLSGHVEQNGDTPQDAYVFIQDASVDPQCAGSLGEQRTKYINNAAIKATAGFSGFIMDGTDIPAPTPPATGVDWTLRTQPFVIKLGVEKVLICAYTNYIVDQVVAFGVSKSVDQPKCNPASRTATRGKPLSLKCNFSGAVYARWSAGGKTVKRKVSLKASGESGRGKLPTRGTKLGTNRLAFSLDGKAYGSPLKVRMKG